VVRYMVKNLEAGTTYNFSIRAYDAVDNLSEPLSVSFATLADYDSASKVIRVSVNSDGMDANDDSLCSCRSVPTGGLLFLNRRLITSMTVTQTAIRIYFFLTAVQGR
jgi:hypothetical protein